MKVRASFGGWLGFVLMLEGMVVVLVLSFVLLWRRFA